jgi:hypothetical protein
LVGEITRNEVVGEQPKGELSRLWRQGYTHWRVLINKTRQQARELEVEVECCFRNGLFDFWEHYSLCTWIRIIVALLRQLAYILPYWFPISIAWLRTTTHPPTRTRTNSTTRTRTSRRKRTPIHPQTRPPTNISTGGVEQMVAGSIARHSRAPPIVASNIDRHSTADSRLYLESPDRVRRAQQIVACSTAITSKLFRIQWSMLVASCLDRLSS